MGIEITKKEIIEYEKMEKISEITMIREKIRLFEVKYGSSHSDFKKKMKSREEKFEEWDDFIEWTANIKLVKKLITQLEKIENAQKH